MLPNNPLGLFSTEPQLPKVDRKSGLLTVLQIFIIDTQAVGSDLNRLASLSPDMVEIMQRRECKGVAASEQSL